MKNESKFKAALRNAMLDKAREYRLDGTTAMSRDNLFQCMQFPSRSIEGAPLGTNGRYYLRTMFDEIIDASATLKPFTAI